jgi:phage terminase Nu1 subunit (DNA packaging protein)
MSVLDGYVDKPELAAQLQKSTRTLDRWDRLGIGPAKTKVGRLTLYRVDSVKDWLASQEQGPRRVAMDSAPRQRQERRER